MAKNIKAAVARDKANKGSKGTARKAGKADPRKGTKGKAVAKVAARKADPAPRSRTAQVCAITGERAPGQMLGTGIYLEAADKVTGLPKDNPAAETFKGEPSAIHARWAATLAFWRKRKGKPASVAELLAVKGGLHRGDIRHWSAKIDPDTGKGFIRFNGKPEFIS